MRLALIVFGSLDQVSGGYLYDRKLVERLAGRGHAVEIISLADLPYGLLPVQNFSARLPCAEAAARFDVLLEDELGHASLFLYNERLRRAGRARPKLAALVHHLRSSEEHTPAGLALSRRLERRFLSGVDAFVFNSSSTRGCVMELLGSGRPDSERPGIVANPAGDHLTPAGCVEKSPGRLELLFVGNLIPRKGLHLLLEALRRLYPGPDWRLTVAGGARSDPLYASRLRAAARFAGDRIRFVGRVADAELARLYQLAHVLVVPSRFEGFGIVFLEAMAHSAVPVAGEAGGAGEIIDDGRDGFLVPPGDPGRLACIIGRLAVDRMLLARMAAAAREKWRSFKGWDESMDAAVDFLEGISGGRS